MLEQYVVKFLVFHASGGISSSPAAFLFLVFLSIKLSSSCVSCPSLMSNCLLIILVIGSWVTFRGFPRKFSKYCFHTCIHSSWLVAFSLSFAVLLLLFASFTICHAIPDCLSSTESQILLIWFYMYSVFFFWYMRANSFHAFLNFRALILVGFLLLHLEAVFMSACFVLTANVSHGTLGLALWLSGRQSAAASKWALMKFSYSSFGVCVSDLSREWSSVLPYTSV